MEGLPVPGLYILNLALDIRNKTFLTCLRFHSLGAGTRPGCSPFLLTAIIHDQSVFSFYVPAYLVPCKKIPVRLMTGQCDRVDHIIGYMDMQVVRVFVNTAMALMLLKAQRLCKR